jgi:hypothetical protein
MHQAVIAPTNSTTTSTTMITMRSAFELSAPDLLLSIGAVALSIEIEADCEGDTEFEALTDLVVEIELVILLVVEMELVILLDLEMDLVLDLVLVRDRVLDLVEVLERVLEIDLLGLGFGIHSKSISY